MAKVKIIFCIIFIFIPLLNALSQDRSSDINLLKWQKDSERFKREMLAKDITFADFAQLKSMAMALGLEEMDNATAYRNALAQYYNIKLFESKPKKGELIILERAGELKMVKVKEENEENLHITGKTKLILNSKDDKQQNTTRTIEADDIYIDLKNKEITGIGNVYFKDDGLEFEGEQFYFNFNINRGVLFNGRTKILKSGESGLKDAYFIGERIVQSNQDDAILYNGNLTTCSQENPHYYIKVSKIWINQKGEWGILNGVLYLGPIPFMYIPIYYHPKDLIINPVFGYKSKQGWYLNTTYFILGEKSESKQNANDVFGIDKNRAEPTAEKSYFRITKTQIDDKLTNFYDKYEFYKKYPNFRILPQINSMDFALRFFADAYTNLGFYFGGFYYMKVDSQVSPFAMVALSDFAFSRLLWKNPEAEGYLPYNPVHKTKSITFENKYNYIHEFSRRNTYYYLDANPLTFRTSQWLKFSGNINGNINNQPVKFNYEGYVEYASDENYFRDFYARQLSFTYIDVIFDALKYSIESQNKKMANFSSEADETTSSKTELKNYLKMDFSPPKIPSLFGLDFIGNTQLKLASTLTLRSSVVADYAPNSTESDKKYNGGVDDPRYKRYMFETFTLPELSYTMDGVILDYNTFVNMPTKIVESRNKDNNKEKNILNDLFINIETIRNTDPTKDAKEIDYKDMFVFFSRKNIVDSNDNIMKEYKFNDVLKFGDTYSYKKELEKEAENKIVTSSLKEEYYNPKKIEKETNSTYEQIKPIDFNLKYSLTNNMINTFKFKSDVSSDNEYDSVQKLFLNKFTLKNIERFYLNEDLSFKLSGALQVFTIGSSSLLKMSPSFDLKYVKWYDVIDLYEDYLSDVYGVISKTIPIATFESMLNKISDVNESNFLKEMYPTKNSTNYVLKDGLTDYEKDRIKAIFENVGYQNPDVLSRVEAIEKSNRAKSELKVYYADTLINDLSFGKNILSGTNITTSFALDVFKHNEQTAENYRKLNELNSGNQDYEYINTDYYFNRITYERIQKLSTSFNFSLNPLPQDSNHKLTFSVSPSINWVIPQETLTKMKSILWNDNTNDIKYDKTDSEMLAVAKDFIYYRTKGENIYDKINSFFDKSNFWAGANYFRKMFTNVKFVTSYSYKRKDVNFVEIKNDLEFKLENIGAFSNGKTTDATSDREILPVIVYPNDTFSINFFNSILTYSMSISFLTEVDSSFTRYQYLKTEQKELDEFKIMKMVNTHNIGFNIDGKLFDVKLPKGSWFRFTSATNFWYYKNQKWNYNKDFTPFYLHSQTFTMTVLMDILTVSLNFKAFDFKDRGYGFELDSGSIKIGYNVTEIPVFWNYFKFNISPNIGFDFVVKHNDYYDGATLYQYNTSYYSSNKLTHNLSFELIIGQGTDFETIFKFSTRSENNEMYKFFSATGVTDFFEDLGKSFNFADISQRKASSFKLKEINFTITHKLHDWYLSFSYKGLPVKNTTTNRYNWDNTFTFSVEWKLDSENQLMKMFNKTKLLSNYKDGEWQQPVVNLDANK